MASADAYGFTGSPPRPRGSTLVPPWDIGHLHVSPAPAGIDLCDTHCPGGGACLPRALAAAPWIGRWRQTRAETRNGLGAGCSWPLSHLKGLGKSLRRAGLSYGFVAEEGYLPGGMKRRMLRYLFVGPSPGPSPSPSARADPGRDAPPTLGPVGPTATAIMPSPIT